MLELKKKSPNRGYTTDPVHIAEVGAGLWGMLPFSTKAIREERCIRFFREGLGILQVGLARIMPLKAKATWTHALHYRTRSPTSVITHRSSALLLTLKYTHREQSVHLGPGCDN